MVTLANTILDMIRNLELFNTLLFYGLVFLLCLNDYGSQTIKCQFEEFNKMCILPLLKANEIDLLLSFITLMESNNEKY